MNIGQASHASGVSAKMIRYYEEIELIPPAARSDSGYRAYTRSDVHRLRFIRRAKALGFTLEEIAGLLDLSARRTGDMSELKQAAELRLQALDARIAELERVRAGLLELVAICPGHGALTTCPILAALSES